MTAGKLLQESEEHVHLASKEGRKACIFCGETRNLSKEHIFADWMAPYLPPSPEGTLHVVEYFSHDDEGQIDERVRERGRLQNAGDHRARGLKVVCRPCNNGWMSRLQELARPYLEPRLQSRWAFVPVAGQRAIACWAAMFSMVFEASQPETASFSQAQRTAFKISEGLEPPQDLLVWLARMENGPFRPISVWHKGLRQGSMVGAHPKARHLKSLCHVQLTGAVADKLYIQTFSQSTVDLDARRQLELQQISESFGLIQVWPPVLRSIFDTPEPMRDLRLEEFPILMELLQASIGCDL